MGLAEQRGYDVRKDTFKDASGKWRTVWKKVPVPRRRIAPPASGPSRDLKGAITGAIGGFATGGVMGGIMGGITGAFTGSRPPPGMPAPPMIPTPGLPGAIQRTLPGGRSGYQPAPGYSIPKPGARGAIERILPFGSTGMIDSQIAPIVQPEEETRLKAPRGYVIVTLPDGNKVGMLKVLARKYGLWKPRPKPPVSGWDMKAINRAAGAKKRVKKLAGKVGFTATEKGRARRSSGKSCGHKGRCKC